MSPRSISQCWLGSSCFSCYDVTLSKRDRDKHCKAKGTNSGPVNYKEDTLDPKVEGRGLLCWNAPVLGHSTEHEDLVGTKRTTWLPVSWSRGTAFCHFCKKISSIVDGYSSLVNPSLTRPLYGSTFWPHGLPQRLLDQTLWLLWLAQSISVKFNHFYPRESSFSTVLTSHYCNKYLRWSIYKDKWFGLAILEAAVHTSLGLVLDNEYPLTYNIDLEGESKGWRDGLEVKDNNWSP